MKKYLVTLFILILFSECNHTILKNITSEGFINDNCFQLILCFKPDSNTKGLVHQRNSSQLKAKKNINKFVLNKLIKYFFLFNDKNTNFNINNIQNDKKIQKFLYTKLNYYFNKGKIAHTYYDEDNSIIIFYRIISPNLRKEINSIKIAATINKKQY